PRLGLGALPVIANDHALLGEHPLVDDPQHVRERAIEVDHDLPKRLDAAHVTDAQVTDELRGEQLVEGVELALVEQVEVQAGDPLAGRSGLVHGSLTGVSKAGAAMAASIMKACTRRSS